MSPANRCPDPIDFASVDVSFISLKLVLPVAAELLRGGGGMVCLVKPQFEAGRGKVGKKGVVRERATHVEVLENAVGYAAENGFSVAGSTFRRSRGRRATSNTSCTSARRRGAPSRNVRRSRRWWSVPTRRLTESLEGMWCGWSRKPY